MQNLQLGGSRKHAKGVTTLASRSSDPWSKFAATMTPSNLCFEETRVESRDVVYDGPDLSVAS